VNRSKLERDKAEGVSCMQRSSQFARLSYRLSLRLSVCLYDVTPRRVHGFGRNFLFIKGYVDIWISLQEKKPKSPFTGNLSINVVYTHKNTRR
jgi:hypothetical protein